jgi:hypothetical protein
MFSRGFRNTPAATSLIALIAGMSVDTRKKLVHLRAMGWARRDGFNGDTDTAIGMCSLRERWFYDHFA